MSKTAVRVAGLAAPAPLKSNNRARRNRAAGGGDIATIALRLAPTARALYDQFDLTLMRSLRHPKPMLQLICLSLTLAFSVAGLVAQQRVPNKPEGDTRRADLAQRQAEEAQRKAQAVDILKGVVEGAKEIEETRTHVTVLTGALDLLWKHDDAYARAQFIKSAAALSDRFASSATDRRERSEIRASMGILLKAFARHDPRAANRLLDKFQNLLEEVLKGNSVSPGERLSLAEAGLESDTAQSAALAAKVLEAGVPGSFPSYLNQLEQRDAATAASLFRTALSRLARGAVYNPVHATVLSAYIFRESQMSVPRFTGGREGVPLEFGMFASPLSPPTTELNLPLVQAYLVAASSFLNVETMRLEQNADPDAISVSLCFFLIKKLRGYADRLGLDRGQHWAVLDAKFTILAERAKVTPSVLSGLTSVAQRIVTENTVFRFDGGDGAFAAAEKALDPPARAELLATGIRQLIDDGKYPEAVQKIAGVPDEKFQEQLNAYRSFRMAEAAIRTLDWHGFNAQVNRVSAPALRAYLFLSAAHVASDATNKNLSDEFLVVAMALIPKIDDVEERAAALVAVAGILYKGADTSWGAQVLNEVVKAINRAEGYDGRVYGVTLEAPKYKVRLPLPTSDLNQLFEQAAKRDWPTSIAAAQSIDSKALRSRAYIAACRTVVH